jgi:hypothetical protein
MKRELCGQNGWIGVVLAAGYAAVDAHRNAQGTTTMTQMMTPRLLLRIVTIAAFMASGTLLDTKPSRAQEIDFSQIDKFESLGTGTLQVGDPAKTIVDDGGRYTVFLTIYEADADTKVSWTSTDTGAAKTTVIPGRAVQAFQTAGAFRLEATGEPYHSVKYGYVLLHAKK